MEKAVENLASREETTVENIFYIRAMSNNEKLKNQESIIHKNSLPIKDKHGRMWCIEKNSALRLPRHKIEELAQWAFRENYDAVIWTGLGMTPDCGRSKLIELLKNNSHTLHNTKEYILNSPDMNELTQFEKNILADDL